MNGIGPQVNLNGTWVITNTWIDAQPYHFTATLTGDGTIVDIQPPPPGAKFFGTWSITQTVPDSLKFEVSLAIADFGQNPSITAYSGALAFPDQMSGNMTGDQQGQDSDFGTWSAVRLPSAPPGVHKLPK